MRLEINGTTGPNRLDLVLKSALPDISRSLVQKAIREGSCLVDGRQVFDPALRLRQGQVVDFSPAQEKSELVPEHGDVNIIWHDQDLAVCAKPAGSTVHPCPSCPDGTFVQKLASHFPTLMKMGGVRPGIVHRLDKDTSGLLLIALNENTRVALAEEFARRKIGKEYLAIVAGVPPAAGQCLEPLGRDPRSKIRMAIVPEKNGGKCADTAWEVLWSAPNQSFSLLRVTIHTGRTHQIRVHMSSLGYPLIGDRLYAPGHIALTAPRQMLHAWHITFAHPRTGENLDFHLSPPADFKNFLLKNGLPMQRIVVTGTPGCGKSAFCHMLEKRGIPIVSADRLVEDMYQPGGELPAWLYTHASPDCLTPAGAVDKAKILELMENGGAMRRDFENHVHTLVLHKIEKFFGQCETNGCRAACAEIPLYFECGWQKIMPALTVGIECADEIRKSRLLGARGWSTDKIASIDGWQLPQPQKMGYCDHVFANGGSMEELERRVSEFVAILNSRQERNTTDLNDMLDKFSG